ncbi:MAG TPA: FGGY family carbohydrate kinase [Candidatus Nanopelagicales bacterium]|nr:FGGY family carbohydrate kinase [Candidatus Nanopelagicales bacterium]
MSELVVGIDAGTTRVKALAVDLSGSVLAEAAVPTPWIRSGAQAQMDPDQLIARVHEVLAGLLKAPTWPSDGRVIGIGVTSMAEAGVLVGPSGDAVAPAIAFHDPRGRSDLIKQAIDRETFHGHVGMRLNNKPSVAKILWLQENVATAKSATTYLSIAEWIVYRLGGEQVSEISLVSRTGLFDVVERVPWQATLDLVGNLLPGPVTIAGDPCGNATNVPDPMRGAALTATGMDHQSAAFACGAATTGALFDSMGTAEALLRFAPGPLPREELVRLAERDVAVLWSVIPDHVCVLGALVTGLSLERIRQLLGVETFEQRADLAQRALAAPTAPTAGLQLADVGHTGLSISGVDDDATPAGLWRAGVTQLVDLGQELLHFMEAASAPRQRTVLAGGWVHDEMVLAAKHAAIGEFEVSEVDEAGALGAAMFGAIAAGAMQRPAANAAPRWPTAS